MYIKTKRMISKYDSREDTLHWLINRVIQA